MIPHTKAPYGGYCSMAGCVGRKGDRSLFLAITTLCISFFIVSCSTSSLSSMKTIVHSDQAPAPIGPYSQGVKVQGSLFYFSGQIPLDATGAMIEGGIAEQTHQVCKNIQALLHSQGLTFDNVVKTTVFLKDMGEFGAMNEVYAQYFGTSKPARSTVEVARLPKDVRVEIEVIAVAP